MNQDQILKIKRIKPLAIQIALALSLGAMSNSIMACPYPLNHEYTTTVTGTQMNLMQSNDCINVTDDVAISIAFGDSVENRVDDFEVNAFGSSGIDGGSGGAGTNGSDANGIVITGGSFALGMQGLSVHLNKINVYAGTGGAGSNYYIAGNDTSPGQPGGDGGNAYGVINSGGTVILEDVVVSVSGGRGLSGGDSGSGYIGVSAAGGKSGDAYGILNNSGSLTLQSSHSRAVTIDAIAHGASYAGAAGGGISGEGGSGGTAYGVYNAENANLSLIGRMYISAQNDQSVFYNGNVSTLGKAIGLENAGELLIKSTVLGITSITGDVILDPTSHLTIIPRLEWNNKGFPLIQIYGGSMTLNGTFTLGSPDSSSPISNASELSKLPVNYKLISLSKGDFIGNFTNADSSDYINGQLVISHPASDIADLSYIGGTLAWTDDANTSYDGSFTISTGNSFNVDIPLSDQAWGNTLIKNGAGTLTLSDINWYTGGTFINDGTLVLTNNHAAGTGAIANNASLDLNFSGDFANNITGSGITNINGSPINLTGNSSLFYGQWNIANDAQATIAATHLGQSTIKFGNENSRFNINGVNDYVGNSTLNGAGIYSVNLGDSSHTFSFGSAMNTNAFSGTMALANASFNLDDDTNKANIINNTLQLNSGSIATSTLNNTIGNLTFNGGTLNLPAFSFSGTNILTIANLDATASGFINYALPAGAVVNPNTSNSLFDQTQQSAISQYLFKVTGTITGQGALLNMINPSNSDSQQAFVYDANGIQATTVYGYAGIIDNVGAYVAYTLTGLDLTNTNDAFTLNNEGATNNRFGATITGAGNFNLVDSTGDGIVLAGNSNYSGTTNIATGSVTLNTDNALGNTSLLTMAPDTSLIVNNGVNAHVGSLTMNNSTINLNGSLTSGMINTTSADTINMNGGSLILTNGGVLNAVLSNTGTTQANLNLAGGTLEINSENTSLSNTSIAIANGATMKLAHMDSLGSSTFDQMNGILAISGAGTLNSNITGTGIVALSGGVVTLTDSTANFAGSFSIDNNSILTMNTSSDQVMNNSMTGSGQFTKEGTGNLSLVNNTTLTTMNLNEGGLIIDNNSILTTDIKADPTNVTSLHIASGTLIGSIDPTDVTIDSNGNWVIIGNGGVSTVNSLTTAGHITFDQTQVGQLLTVLGNYVSNGTTIVMNAVLGDDNSKSDHLAINGTITGTTNVAVVNVKGAGAKTTNGIELITASSSKAGDFVLVKPVVAGAYEYDLFQGTPTNVADTNWYLRSTLMFRPEAGIYLSNQYSADHLFINSMEDRANGPLFFSDVQDKSYGYNAWGHVINSRSNSKTADGHISQTSTMTSMQVGSDLLYAINGNNRYHLGWSLGAGHVKNEATSEGVNSNADGKVTGYAFGLYGTWYANSNNNGFYADTWLQYGWFKNDVTRDGLAKVNYNSHNLNGSLEFGYSFQLTNNPNNQWYIQPQAQIIYSKYSQNDLTEANGTIISMHDTDGFTTRLGARIYGRIITEGKSKIQPILALNWWHGSQQSAVQMDDFSVHQGLPKDRFEAKVGLNIALNNAWSVNVDLAGQLGQDHYKSIQGQLGVQYKF